MIVSKKISTPLLLLAVAAVASTLFLLSPTSAEARPIGGTVFGLCKSKAKVCDNFLIGFSGDKIGPKSSGTICWLGNCKSARVNNRKKPVLYARYKNVGPYRCGSPTTITVRLKGRLYKDRAKIACGYKGI